MRLIKHFIFICAVLFLTACKIEIVVPENGRVSTASGAYDCEPGETCTIDVVDLFFDETFVAEPAEGFAFQGWKKANKHFCGGSKQECRLLTSGFEGQDALLGILESDRVFSLIPVFVDPEGEALPLFHLVGTWSYVHNWGGCTASGQILQSFVEGEGIYQTFAAGSRQVSIVDPCDYVTAEVETRVGPISTIQSASPNEFQLQAAYTAAFGFPNIVEIISPDKYRVSANVPGGANITTYARISD